MIRNFGLTAFLLLALFLSVQIAPAQDGSAADGTAAANSSGSSEASLQGIWKANLGEKEIVIAISQSGEALFGLAKFEGDNPWNGAVSGAVSLSETSSTAVAASSSAPSSEGTAFLSLAAFEGDAVTSTFIRADLQDGAMLGIFIRTESNGMASRGDFAATMISPDTSAYTPATVASVQASAAAAAPEQADLAPTEAETDKEDDAESGEEGSMQGTAAAGTGSAESRFKDVTKLAKGINPNIMPRMAPL